MKRLLFIIISIIATMLTVSSCKTGTFATEGGKEETAYLQIFSSETYANKIVDVVLDKTTKFSVTVRKAKQSTEKHNYELHAIKPGKRHIKVTYEGNVIYEKDIFVTSQQTKTIIL